MKKFNLILTFLISNIGSLLAASKDEEPLLIVSGKNLQKNLTVQILISLFLLIAWFDFIFQTLLLFYVFSQLAQKLKKKSDIGFSLLGIFVFILLRCTFVMFFILPIPWSWAPELPDTLVNIFIYLNMTLFIIFYGFSISTCFYYMIFIGTTGKKMGGILVDPKTGIEPMVVILMPIYNEEPDALFRAVESAIRCNYRSDRLHVFLAFDEVSETALYFSLLKKLHVLSKEVSEEIKSKLTLIPENDGNANFEIFPPRLEWYIEGVRVTVCRFPHEGKSPTQAKSFKIINEMYGNQSPDIVANTLLLFIDSDIILHENAIHNFVVNAVANPKIRGMTGLVTCRTSRNFNIYQYLQDAEYIDGQMFSRTAEAALGAVTCLPGALSLIRLSALQNVAPKYFIEIDKRRSVDFHRFHLGEDRYMTYLLTEDAEGPYQVRFVSSATCKTDAPDTFQKLLKQRRRWFLGGFVNDVSTMISPVMWKKVPFVVLINIYFYSSRGLSWIFPILLISLCVNENPGLALYFVAITFGVRFLLLSINSCIMTRNKVCFSYILLYFVSPVFIWIVTLYAAWTWNVRSWGGPRTDQDTQEFSKLTLLDSVMSAKEETSGKTRKSLGQIKTVSRVIDSNLRNQNGGFNSVRSTRSVRSNHSGKSSTAPLKKFVPFPYETEFLGGGDYDMSDASIVIPPTPIKLSISSSISSTHSELNPLSPNLLNPGGFLHHSCSMPELNTLSESSAPYLFAKLSPETKQRASSFRLDTSYLAKVEELATMEHCKQRKSSFNMRLSGRTTPTSPSNAFKFPYPNNSQPSSVYGDEDLSDQVVDIVIHVPQINIYSNSG